MNLRPATGSDVAGIAALERALFGVDAWSRAAVTAELSGDDRVALVAVSGGRLTGYVITMRTDDGTDLHRIGVRASHRRSGTAHALLEAALERAVADGATRMLLEVSAANTAAIAFYAAEGFVEIDRRRRYYRDGSDALVLHRPLGRAADAGRG